ncbi:hypothetical protein [Comamonas testosteroni]|uniref:hypothetical protein n=1 Tax=Comamonas testosteroni TaxID=285 RepID=UPI000A7F9127|nr:hypothetical protein [Comamonas testosteroni]
MSSTNGCLGRVTGPELGAALKTLPPAGRESAATITADIDTMMLGRVRLTYALTKSNMHRWAIQYFWSPVHAEVLSTLSPDEVKDEMLERWLRWSEARLNEGDVSTLDTSVYAFYESLLHACPLKIHALSPDPVALLKKWITEDAQP